MSTIPRNPTSVTRRSRKTPWIIVEVGTCILNKWKHFDAVPGYVHAVLIPT